MSAAVDPYGGDLRLTTRLANSVECERALPLRMMPQEENEVGQQRKDGAVFVGLQVGSPVVSRRLAALAVAGALAARKLLAAQFLRFVEARLDDPLEFARPETDEMCGANIAFGMQGVLNSEGDFDGVDVEGDLAQILEAARLRNLIGQPEVLEDAIGPLKEPPPFRYRACQANDDGTKFRGCKPTYNWASYSLAVDLINQSVGVAEIARRTGLRRQTIYRIKAEPERHG